MKWDKGMIFAATAYLILMLVGTIAAILYSNQRS
jgi:hypothetical protein